MNELELFKAMKEANLKASKVPTYNMSKQQLIDLEKRMYDKAYHDAYVNALEDANHLLIILTCMYLIDNFRCKEQGLLKFIQFYEHMNKLYKDGQFTLKDLVHTIHEETGLDLLAGEEKQYAKRAVEKC